MASSGSESSSSKDSPILVKKKETIFNKIGTKFKSKQAFEHQLDGQTDGEKVKGSKSPKPYVKGLEGRSASLANILSSSAKDSPKSSRRFSLFEFGSKKKTSATKKETERKCSSDLESVFESPGSRSDSQSTEDSSVTESSSRGGEHVKMSPMLVKQLSISSAGQQSDWSADTGIGQSGTAEDQTDQSGDVVPVVSSEDSKFVIFEYMNQTIESNSLKVNEGNNLRSSYW